MSQRILAAVMVAPRQPIEIREFSAPDLPPGSALLRTERSEVCGTDVHLWHGRLSGVPYPIIPGHVSAGTLQAVRGPLTGLDGSNLREGDRVAFFDVHRTCGRCRACTVHRTPTRCVARRVYGITDSADEGLFGGWSQAIYLEPGVGLARLPDSVGFDDYIGGGCGLLTAVHILERAALRPGDSVLVQGTGAVGQLLNLARDGGRYVIAGHYTDVGESSINAHRQINRKHLEIRGCWGSEAGHFLRALTFLERYSEQVPWREIGGRTYPLNGLNEALADAEAMRITKALVDPWATA